MLRTMQQLPPSLLLPSSDLHLVGCKYQKKKKALAVKPAHVFRFPSKHFYINQATDTQDVQGTAWIRMKKGCLVYNRKHFITKKLSYTEGALSAAFPQLFFIEITRLFFFFLPLNGGKKNKNKKKNN